MSKPNLHSTLHTLISMCPVQYTFQFALRISYSTLPTPESTLGALNSRLHTPHPPSAPTCFHSTPHSPPNTSTLHSPDFPHQIPHSTLHNSPIHTAYFAFSTPPSSHFTLPTPHTAHSTVQAPHVTLHTSLINTYPSIHSTFQTLQSYQSTHSSRPETQ